MDLIRTFCKKMFKTKNSNKSIRILFENTPSISKYGLMIERLSDGSVVSNINIYGLKNTKLKYPDWTLSGEPRALIAISVIINLLQLPSEESAPLAHLRTNRYKSSKKKYDKLSDGQTFSSLNVPIAYKFAVEYMNSNCDKNSLTISIESLKESIKKYINELYPDMISK